MSRSKVGLPEKFVGSLDFMGKFIAFQMFVLL